MLAAAAASGHPRSEPGRPSWPSCPSATTAVRRRSGAAPAERLDQMRVRLHRRTRAHLPRVRQHGRALARRRLWQLAPVELQRTARLMLQPDRLLHRLGLVALALRPQPERAQLPDQPRIGRVEPQVDQLLERTVANTGTSSANRALSTRVTAPRSSASARAMAFAGQVLRDRRAIPAGVPGDGRLQPAPRTRESPRRLRPSASPTAPFSSRS